MSNKEHNKERKLYRLTNGARAATWVALHDLRSNILSNSVDNKWRDDYLGYINEALEEIEYPSR